MNQKLIADSCYYVGVDDTTLDLFESQYPVPNGVSYNSYVITDEKIAILDTVDGRKTEEWLKNLEDLLDDRKPDYLVISHMEPDHAANIEILAEKYPDMQLVGNAKTFPMLSQFFDMDFTRRTVIVKEGDILELGTHSLQFFMAPMVHWPEVMVSYDAANKMLFSADGFGTFGALKKNITWISEARRYYINIVGKYGMPVQGLLKKAATLDIQAIAPLHGPVLTENLGFYLEKYNIWSSYIPEEKGTVVAYASIHGNTAKAAHKMAEILQEKGEKVVLFDLSRCDMSSAVEAAFQYDKMILAAATYDGGLFPPMADFLHHLKSKNFQNRKVALIENGSWGPLAAKAMKTILEPMKNIEICEQLVTIRSAMKPETVDKMVLLAEEFLK